MRLSRPEIAAIIRVLGHHLKQDGAELYLFGSRAQDRSRGGDIDLLVLAPAAAAKALRRRKHFLLAELKEELGEQRIDLTLSEPTKARQDPFLSQALGTAVLLKRWEPVAGRGKARLATT